MLARLKTWVGRSRRWKLERFAGEHGFLSEREQREVERLREEQPSFGLKHISPDRNIGNRPGT
jgi:hypothetical protein